MIVWFILLIFVCTFIITQSCDYETTFFKTKRYGFGSHVTGGKGGDLCEVTSLSNTGTGSLRTCLSKTTPQWIIFKVSGTISLDTRIFPKSDKTIDGRGADITIVDNGIWLYSAKNIIIHNIKIGPLSMDPGDCISVNSGSYDVWIDHVTMTVGIDELLSIVGDPSPYGVTVSNCKFYNHGKVMLISSGPTADYNKIINVTLHNNFFDNTGERHPRLRFGKCHLFNNYINNWKYYGAGSSQFGQLYSERNIYEAGSQGGKNAFTAESLGTDPDNGYGVSVNDLLLNGAYIKYERLPCFTPSDYYSYFTEPANNVLKEKIKSEAGFQDVDYCHIFGDITENECNGKTNSEGACGYPEKGACTGFNKCTCSPDYFGLWCESPVCDNPDCNSHEYCSAVDTCLCLSGWSGVDCLDPTCTIPCAENSECIAPNLCQCDEGFTGENCDIEEGTECNPACNSHQECSHDNVCVCKNGFTGKECFDAVCDPKCNEFQNCSSPNICSCFVGYVGKECEYRDCYGNYAGINCDKCLYGYVGDACSIYLFKGNWGWVLPTTLTTVILLCIAIAVVSVLIALYLKLKKPPKPFSNIEVTSELDTLVASEVEAPKSKEFE